MAKLFNDGHQLLSENYHLDNKDKEIDYPKAKIVLSKINDYEFEVEVNTFVRAFYFVAPNNNVVFSDNFFVLMPNTKKRITVNTPIDLEKLEIMCLNNIYK